MSQTEKAQLYNELKAAGVQFSKHYREYNTQELGEAVARLRASQPAPAPAPEAEELSDPEAEAAFAAMMGREPSPEPAPAPVQSEQPVAPSLPLSEPPVQPQPQPLPRTGPNPNEMPGQRLNQQAEDEPIRVDESGLVWYQEEVRKPAYPKPRGRRVLKYMDTGTKTERVKAGEYVEEFEVAGDLPSRPAEVKITLPSYQVGIYKDPRFPFKIHVYNETRGFDLNDVQDYYGGSELVPPGVKRMYVENVLCYDIRTVVRDIQKQYRDLQLQGKA